MIDLKNIEQLLDRFAEGTLSPDEEAKVQAWLEANAELLSTPLVAPHQAQATMPGKEHLYRRPLLAPVWRAVAAACVVAVVATVPLWHRQPAEPAPMMASAEEIEAAEPEINTEISTESHAAISTAPAAPAPARQPQRVAPQTLHPAPSRANDPAVAPQQLLAAAPMLAQPQALPLPVRESIVVQADEMVAWVADTIAYDEMVAYSLQLGNQQWLEPVAAPLYYRFEEERQRLGDSLLAFVERHSQPLMQLIKK
ncbi:MAG: hypothetical protein IJ789_03650 [Bacteroidales bacterium]|nr:hypothetical protein [Bacteroidales bacterium]